MMRLGSWALWLLVPFMPVAPVQAQHGSRTISTSSHGIRLTLSLSHQTYARDALIRATVRIENVSHHSALTWIGDGCISTNPFIEVLDGHGQVLDQGPSAVYTHPGCKPIFGHPFLPGRLVVQHVFAVVRGPYLRAVLPIGRNLNVRVSTPKLAIHLVSGTPPTVTVHATGTDSEPFASVERPPGAHGPLYYSGSALCGTATEPQPSLMELLWSPARSKHLSSGCLRTRAWHGLVGYLNYPVAPIDYVASR